MDASGMPEKTLGRSFKEYFQKASTSTFKKHFSLPDQTEAVAVSPILPPTYWGSQLLSS